MANINENQLFLPQLQNIALEDLLLLQGGSATCHSGSGKFTVLHESLRDCVVSRYGNQNLPLQSWVSISLAVYLSPGLTPKSP